MLHSEFDNLVKWRHRQKPFYENYYLKVNYPSLGVALWLRYTFLSPAKGEPSMSVWAIFSDLKDPRNNVALKETFPISDVIYKKSTFEIKCKSFEINNFSAKGAVNGLGRTLAWELAWEPSRNSFRIMPEPFYWFGVPSTKVVTPNMACAVSGYFSIDGVKYPLNGHRLHQGHVWGKSYSKRWAWANCIDFAEDKSAVLELLSKPPLGLGYFSCRDLEGKVWLKGKYDANSWHFSGRSRKFKIDGSIGVATQNIIGVTYDDPTGGKRFCYNTKIADAVVEIRKKLRKGWGSPQRFTSVGACAFETVESFPVSGLELGL